jgi:MSHA pilin protein MshC
MKPQGVKNDGFTLVELVTILVVTGILAAFAVPRMMDRTGFVSRGFFDQAQGIVRYAQKIAIAQRRTVFVVVSATQIQVCYDAGCTSPVTDPSTGGALSAPHLPTGAGAASFSGVTLSPVTFCFDSAGAPSAGATINVNSTGVGDINRTFFVEPVTGYVHN